MVNKFSCLPWQKAENYSELIKTVKFLPINWKLTPLSGKKPIRKYWQNESPLTKKEIKLIIEHGESKISQKGIPWRIYPTGIGLRTGKISNGLLAIDFDGHSASTLFEAIFPSIFPNCTVSWTSGKKGRFQVLFQATPQQREKLLNFTRFVVTNYKNTHCSKGEQLEFRYNKCQSALPPSYHPDTGNYKWINSPFNNAIANLPKIVVEFLINQTEVVQKITIKKPLFLTKINQNNEEKLISTLYSIDPDCEYSDWIKIGMALYSEGDNYLSVWDNWSSFGKKYIPGECEKKWRSFKNTRVSIASIYYLAKNYK